MATQTNTVTNTAPPSGAPARPTKKQVCEKCGNLDASDTLALGDGVGWCAPAGQYRALRIERECNDFCSRRTE